MAGIGVAMSGGGHRATAWGLGTLIYLVEAAKNPDVSSLSSVSGGSIANGVVAFGCDYSAVSPDEFSDTIGPALRHVASEGLIFWGRPTNNYTRTVIGVGLVAAVGILGLFACAVVGVLDAFGALNSPSWLPALTGWLLVGVAAVIGADLVLFARRSVVTDRAIGRVHFPGTGGAPTTLASLSRPVQHVFCATELQTGDQLYLSPRFVYTYRFGPGRPADLALSTAVQASACLPGGFAPRRLPTAPHRFAFTHLGEHRRPATMVLSDGGVYDNMGDQWEAGFADRLKVWPELAAQGAPADELVVVNASGGWTWKPVRTKGRVANEVTGLGRAINVMYDVTTSHRRKGLVSRWRLAERDAKGQRGVLVHIPQSPYDVPDAFAASTDPALQARAQAALVALGNNDADRRAWDQVVAANTEVGTVLGALGVGVTAALLHHSYVLAMVNTHVILGYPLLGIPPLERFEALCR